MSRAFSLALALIIPGSAQAVQSSGRFGAHSGQFSRGGRVPDKNIANVHLNATLGAVSGNGALPHLPAPGFSLPHPVVPIEAHGPVSPAVQPSPRSDGKGPMDQLRGMAPMGSKPEDGASAGRRIDGAKGRKDSEETGTDIPAEPETVTREVAAPVVETLDLRFSREAKKKLKSSALFASARLIGGSGSKWYWKRFKKDVPVRILVGGQTMFVSRVESGKTKKIGELTKADLAGVYSAQTLRRKPIAHLRRQLISELTAYNRYSKRGKPKVITLWSEVRVVSFKPYSEARKLPENIEEPALEPLARRPVEIPQSLAELHRYLPKAVLLDMRLFKDSVPFELLDDMGKLMKAGVYFVLLSDKRSEGPGSVEEMLTKGLTNRQRDQFVRHKLVTLADDGNFLAVYQGSFAKALPGPRFEAAELDLMEFVSRRADNWILREVITKRANEFTVALSAGADAKDYAKSFSMDLAGFGIPAERYHIRTSLAADGRPTVTLRPYTLETAIPYLLEVLREQQGLYANPSDLMVISRDEGLLKATEGSLQPAAHAQKIQGTELVEVSLAAMLEAYRQNLPGDFAASASKITSFLQDKYRVGGDFGNVYMLMGHVMHSAFNWAMWVYRNTGTLPDAAATVALAHKIWEHEDLGRVKNMVENPGETMAGYREAMVSRLREMHLKVAKLLKDYPIVIGTELPNLFGLDRYKGPLPLYRDWLRLVYDLVLARETPGGLEVLVVDFKTGQTPTMQNLEKDVQVQLYDLAARTAWQSLPLPYGLTGRMKKVVAVKVAFVYPTGVYEPSINEWGRIKFEKFLRNVMKRMRRHNNVPVPDGKPQKTPRKKS